MNPILKTILSAGKTPGDSLTRRRSIYLYNGSLWFVTILASAYIPVFYFLGIEFLALLLAGFVMFYGMAIGLQFLGMFTLSRIVFLIAFNSGLSVYHSLTNEQLSFIILYLAFISAANLYTLREERALKVLFIAVPSVLLIFHEVTDIQYLPPLKISDSSYDWLAFFLLPTFVAFFIALEFYLSASFLSREQNLEKARDEAKTADRAKTEFISLMSHELRTPLTALSYMLAEADVKKGQLDASAIAAMKGSVRQMDYLVNNFIDFKTLNDPKQDYPLKDVSIPGLLSNIGDDFRSLLDEQNRKLDIKIEPDAHRWFSVRQEPLQIYLRQLVDNAIRFSNEGPIQIEFEATERSDTESDITLCVIDQGIGISQEHRSKIFEPFFQVETVTDRVIGGMGLGLAIANQCAEQLHGSIHVRSEIGEGTAIALTFPAKRILKPAKAEHARSERPMDGLHALVVDDNPVNRKICQKYLEKLGARTAAVDGGASAIETCRFQRFDFILLDLHMPEVDGFAVSRTVRKSGLNKNAHIIAYTADTQANTQSRAIDAGMDNFLHKPLSLVSLKTIVEQAINEPNAAKSRVKKMR